MMYKIVKVKNDKYYVKSNDDEFVSKRMPYNKCMNLLYKLVLNDAKNMFKDCNIIYDLADQLPPRLCPYHLSLTKM